MSFDSWMRERNPKHQATDDEELSRELRAAYEAGAADARDADVLLCDEFYEYCRRLLRYDGIDKKRAAQAMDEIRRVVDARKAELESEGD